jgi:hypothetical protein
VFVVVFVVVVVFAVAVAVAVAVARALCGCGGLQRCWESSPAGDRAFALLLCPATRPGLAPAGEFLLVDDKSYRLQSQVE